MTAAACGDPRGAIVGTGKRQIPFFKGVFPRTRETRNAQIFCSSIVEGVAACHAQTRPVIKNSSRSNSNLDRLDLASP